MTGILARLVTDERIAPDWAEALLPVEGTIGTIEQFLREEREGGRPWLPSEPHIFRALQIPIHKVRVLIVGQDPYPTQGHPIGLSFAVSRDVSPLPRSLKNIYTELADDLGVPSANHGDLSSWAAQGVMLLNRVLTVGVGAPGSHQKRGWEEVTAHVISTLASRQDPLVAILWGNQARTLAPLLSSAVVIESAHPSPLSASRGFFGSRPFSRTNAALERLGQAPIDWTVQ